MKRYVVTIDGRSLVASVPDDEDEESVAWSHAPLRVIEIRMVRIAPDWKTGRTEYVYGGYNEKGQNISDIRVTEVGW